MYHWLVMADLKPAAYGATVAAPFATVVERVRPHTKLIGLMALGHFVIDVTQGSLPAVLPFVRWGVPVALWISALTPLVAFVLTRLLPAPREATA